MKTITKPLRVIIACLAAWSVHAADAVALWDKHCTSCHAKDGSGDTRMGKKVNVKDYRDPKVQEGLNDDQGIKALKEGLTEKGQQRMKPFADKITDEEIRELIKHLRGFKKTP